jgi:hypothetical protein
MLRFFDIDRTGQHQPDLTSDSDALAPAANGGHGDAPPRAVAINCAKLLACKDEYEAGWLFTGGKFEQQLRDQFEGDFKFSFHLAPPILGGAKDALGQPKKRAFGPWTLPAFQVLAKLRFLQSRRCREGGFPRSPPYGRWRWMRLRS